jgi:predicted protein tyrosine phosphatase
MNEKREVLFVCTVNRMRSATAHKIYENDDRFEVDSAGTDRTANVVLGEATPEQDPRAIPALVREEADRVSVYRGHL